MTTEDLVRLLVYLMIGFCHGERYGRLNVVLGFGYDLVVGDGSSTGPVRGHIEVYLESARVHMVNQQSTICMGRNEAMQ
jgi:hypothetical protein